MRNQPITRVRAREGSRAGQEVSKKREQEREGTAAHTRIRGEGEKLSLSEQHSLRGETLDRSRRVEGHNDSGEGTTLSLSPLCVP